MPLVLVLWIHNQSFFKRKIKKYEAKYLFQVSY